MSNVESERFTWLNETLTNIINRKRKLDAENHDDGSIEMSDDMDQYRERKIWIQLYLEEMRPFSDALTLTNSFNVSPHEIIVGMLKGIQRYRSYFKMFEINSKHLATPLRDIGNFVTANLNKRLWYLEKDLIKDSSLTVFALMNTIEMTKMLRECPYPSISFDPTKYNITDPYQFEAIINSMKKENLKIFDFIPYLRQRSKGQIMSDKVYYLAGPIKLLFIHPKKPVSLPEDQTYSLAADVQSSLKKQSQPSSWQNQPQASILPNQLQPYILQNDQDCSVLQAEVDVKSSWQNQHQASILPNQSQPYILQNDQNCSVKSSWQNQSQPSSWQNQHQASILQNDQNCSVLQAAVDVKSSWQNQQPSSLKNDQNHSVLRADVDVQYSRQKQQKDLPNQSQQSSLINDDTHLILKSAIEIKDIESISEQLTNVIIDLVIIDELKSKSIIYIPSNSWSHDYSEYFVVDEETEATIAVINYKKCHWILLVYEHESKTLHILDSLKLLKSDEFIYNNIKLPTDWIVNMHPNIPQQSNAKDCGIFVIIHAVSYINTKTFVEQITDADVKDLRLKIREKFHKRANVSQTPRNG